MDLVWHGLSCFRITERRRASVVTDPYNAAATGLPPLKLRGDIVTVSHDAPGHNDVSGVTGTPQIITGPGEYEIGGVFVTGIATQDDADEARNVLYLLDFEGLTVVHAGDLRQVPSQSQIEALGVVNVLLVPVGGGGSLTAAQAAEVVTMIEPNYVVPMHYQIPSLKIPLDELDRFLNEMGQSEVTTESSLRVTSTSLPEETQLVVLEPKS